ncbi:MAG TPA: M14 family zinc carboxypeptidase [Longimicrobiales bacterium]|nr:M14 family zinc carboxypeptidase [Longimicrobiales bacterium]
MIRRAILASVAVILTTASAAAQSVPTPRQHFGFEMGQDRKLADWTQLTSYYEKLAETSQRVTVDTLGTTTMGRPFVMLTVTSAENQARRQELHDIQMKLADPRTISGEAELQRLLDQGKTVVLITHGIHATEVGGSQMAARMLYRLATSDDEKVREILDNVILLDIPALNPDGLQWVADYYKQHVGTEYEAAPLPWLYQFYVGHDNNRDWYAFTQDETIHTIEGAHNAWHPQIVHDIHQMGSNGARIFFPPYIDPWEPNIDPALAAAVNQLGTYMAAEVTAQGKAGVVVGGQYDAFTPARAYQHYHAGARILSETASARIATPVDIPFERLGPNRGYDSSQRSWNFQDVWPGGAWGLPDIVDYMEAGAMALLTNAARNRRFWLENFYNVGSRAVAKWDQWPEAWVIPAGQANTAGVNYVLRILTMGDVEVHKADRAFTADGISFPAGSWVVPMRQPYASFAQTMLEVQHYPDLRAYPGGPPLRPYDVTAHTLPYLMDVEAVAVDEAPAVPMSQAIAPPAFSFTLPAHLQGPRASRVGMLKSWQESQEAGWTRWLFDEYGLEYDSLHNADIQRGGLADRYDAIVLQSQSPRSIENGYAAGSVPPQYAGGLGEGGAAALRDFVRAGGRLVAVEDATEYVTELFGLGVGSAVEGFGTTEYYIPGSILRLELDSSSELTQGMDNESIAWYGTGSMAFEVTDPSISVAARYGSGDPLLSGWVLGGDKVAGKPAILEAKVGQGSVVLFGFQPNYRGQTVATFPLLFNALAR